jgi:hypothetical protein
MERPKRKKVREIKKGRERARVRERERKRERERERERERNETDGRGRCFLCLYLEESVEFFAEWMEVEKEGGILFPTPEERVVVQDVHTFIQIRSHSF